MSSAPIPKPLIECPGRDDLLSFSVGKLPAALREQIAAHLDHCARCLALLAELDEGADPLLVELRQPLPSGVFSGPAGQGRQGPKEPVAVPPPCASTEPAEHQATPGPGGAVPAVSARLSPSGASRYRSQRFHARGGLGEVHVAHDQELDREVALKRIRPERAEDSDSRRRFLLEAEITGKLEHPGVVPVYGLVQGAGGQPCYAMRFVQGDSLKEAIERFHAAEGPGRDPGQRGLELRQLLGRFIAVCNTVAYAHSRGIIHRDLKPANILLGKYGETLVVDWGLAKSFARTEAERSSGEQTLAPSSGSGTEGGTQMGQAVGTPAYMSPEQADGLWDRVGPASDLYSLGATLYHLLTGQAPFQGKGQHEVLARARRGDCPPPRQVQRRVPPALEAICLKAMALQPEDRYASALELAADVEHWLADEPVTAYREPWWAQTWRWVRRHRTPVASVAAATLAVLLLGGIGALWLQQQAAERRAEAARREAALRQGILATLDKAADLQKRARWGEARAVLDQAAERLGDAGPTDLRRRVQQARADLRLVGRLDAARLKAATTIGDEFDVSAERDYAAAFRESGLGRPEESVGAVAARIRNSAVREQLVAALDAWALVATDRRRKAWLLAVARRVDPDPWRDRLRDPAAWHNLAVLERLAREAKVAKLSPELLTTLGTLLMMERKAEAVALLTAAQERYPQDFWLTSLLGSVLHVAKRSEEAIGYYRAALALRPDAGPVYNNLGLALRDRGRLDQALAIYRRAVALDPRSALAQYNLAEALQAQGRGEEAATAFRKARAACQKALALDPTLTHMHYFLGRALQAQGRLKQASAAFQKALALNPSFSLAHYNHGVILQAQGRLDQAIAAFQKATALQPDFAHAQCNLGFALQARGRGQQASAAFQKAIASCRKAIATDPGVAQSWYVLGSALHAQGRLREASAAYQKGLELDPRNALAHANLGKAWSDQGRLDQAITCYQKAIGLDPEDAQVRSYLGFALAARGRSEEASAAFHKAIACYRQAIARDPGNAQVHANLGFALFARGRSEEAIPAFQKAVALGTRNTKIHAALGLALASRGRVKEAVAACQQAIGLDKDCAEAHACLGILFQMRGDLDRASAAFRLAIRIKQDYPFAHENLGLTLATKGDLEGAGAAYREALARNPRHTRAHIGLGDVLTARGQFEGAVASYRKAIALDPRLAAAHGNLGFALAAQGRLEEAITAFRQALALDPGDARTHCNLGFALQQQGQLAEALVALRRGHELGSRNPNWSYPSQQAIRDCERQIQLDKRLPAVLQGKTKAGDAERIEFGRLCVAKGLYGAAARFYQEALAKPTSAQDPKAGHRYQAACAAALAGCGQGADGAVTHEQQRRRWRRQALQWLRAELALWSKQREASKPFLDSAIRQLLANWRGDPHLAGLRDEAELAWLPEDERVAWRRFWFDVRELFERTAKGAR
jgi:tetratricopeptide (TPR) repeat protein/tRNA A-37 threonylcarbamoyl transferase component Bud32